LAGSLPLKRGASATSAAIRLPLCKAFVAVVSICWIAGDGAGMIIILPYGSRHPFPSGRRMGRKRIGFSVKGETLALKNGP
jgi:hypothetical protein